MLKIKRVFQITVIIFISSLFFLMCTKTSQDKTKISVDNINSISVVDMTGEKIELSSYDGKVLLIVNVASECGYTPQYKGLQSIYEKYKDKGFEILAFPCNDFGGQEPGTNEQIQKFCSGNFGVTFQLFDKIKVLGEQKAGLYKLLTDNSATGTNDIKWNFEKFIISKDGNIVARFNSKVEPENEELTSVIEKELGRKI